MTDDKRPREWTLYANGQWEGIGWEPRDEFVAIRVTVDKFAYDALALRLKAAEEENKVLSERFVSKTEYDGLEKENDQLREEVERLKLSAKSLIRVPTASGRDRVIDAHKLELDLTRERELTKSIKAHAEKLADIVSQIQSKDTEYSQDEANSLLSEMQSSLAAYRMDYPAKEFQNDHSRNKRIKNIYQTERS